jgi:hypothetical protein
MKESGVELLPVISTSSLPVPAVIAAAGDEASEHFLDFFAANIPNRNTRAAYVQAAAQFFDWCSSRKLGLRDIRPLHMGRIHRSQTENHEPAFGEAASSGAAGAVQLACCKVGGLCESRALCQRPKVQPPDWHHTDFGSGTDARAVELD